MHICHSSTRNTCTECLWVEVGTQFARWWRAFFYRLERLHGLDRRDPRHIWLLHKLFLTSINNDCDAFVDEWNHHPVSRSNTQDQTPSVSHNYSQAIRLITYNQN